MRTDPFRTQRRTSKVGSALPTDNPTSSPAGTAGGAIPLASAPAPGTSSADAGPQPLTLSNGLALVPTVPSLMRPLAYLPGAVAMSAADYFARPELSRSTLDKILKSPRALKHYVEHGNKDTEAFKRGRVIHRLLLEPLEFWKETVVWRGGEKSKGAGSRTRWEAFKSEHAGKDIITEEQEAAYLEIADLFKTHPRTREMLVGAATEAVVFFERAGVKCKSRLDIIRDDEVIDIKTTTDLAEFEKTIYKYGSHRQAEFYLFGASAALRRPMKTFRIVALQVSEDREIDLAVYDLTKDPAVLEDGKVENDENLAYYKRCLETGKWPGYAEAVDRVVERPLWRRS